MTRAPANPDLLAAVAEVARAAGDVAASHYRTALDVERKQDGSPVTIADREAERTAREWIAKRFPGDGIMGEEYGDQSRPGARRWLIDPIDGTKSFVRGVPLWATLIAVCEGNDVLAGAAYFPAVGEMLAAAPGSGCWWNESKCTVSDIADLRDAAALTTDTRFADQLSRRESWDDLAGRAMIARTWGDAYGYLLVATGRAEVMIDPVMNPWDAAPFLPIIEEAGGVFTDWGGARTVFGGSAVATNKALSLEVRRILRGGHGA
jgi:histidinol phosphatase-like enzyme (inositol monophosphatase family)